MSYRRNNEKDLAWRDWLRQNEIVLNECGLPEIVLRSESHWWDFLMHGYLDHHSDPSKFTVDDLSKEQMQCLKKFLESELTANEIASSLILLQLESKLNNAFSES
jgi:hypothetical protein